jgi:hypothetical protein
VVDNRNPYDFEANKTYEETFVENNAELIKELTGTSEVVSLSQTKLDVFAGIDLLVQQGRSIVGIALRIRKPTAYKWRYNFTLGHHISKPNSQIHTVMNSLHSTEVLYPNYILQINGIEDNGYCADCVAIKIQTNLFADKYLKDKIITEEIESYYNNRLASYEFSMRDVHSQTDSGVDFFEVQDNTIIKQVSNVTTTSSQG